MPSIRLIIWKDDLREDGTCPISIRVTKDRKSIYIPTGQYIDPRYWKKGVKANYPEYTRLTLLLQDRENEVRRRLLDEEIKNPHVTVVQLKDLLKRKDTNFFLFAEKDKKRYSGSTMKKYNGTITKIKEFYGESLAFSEITHDFLLKFETYLKGIGNNKNTIAGRMNRLRTILYAAHKSGEADRNNNPFDFYKIKWVEGETEYFTEDEIQLIRKVNDKNKNVNLARDIWLFQLNCWGMRISDALMLKWANIDDKYRVTYNMFKTKKKMGPIELTDEAIRILGKRRTGYVFPLLDRYKDIESAEAFINRKLKEVMKKAELNKNLTTHTARHSFGNKVAEKIGNTWTAKDLLGHSNVATTEKYIKRVSNKDLNEANKKAMS